MKQITLRTQHFAFREAGGPCLVRLAFAWALYGYAVAFVWRALSPDPWGGAAAWTVALLGGLALAVWTGGV